MKKKITNKRLLAAMESHERWLTSMGVNDSQLRERLPRDKKGKRVGIYDLPDLRVDKTVKTSDRVAGNGAKRAENVYTGTEIMGISITHKSNLVPIRRDNPEAAKDIAAMRR
jgi:hypothetical protein